MYCMFLRMTLYLNVTGIIFLGLGYFLRLLIFYMQIVMQLRYFKTYFMCFNGFQHLLELPQIK